MDKSGKVKKLKTKNQVVRYFDYELLVMVVLLIAFGLLMLYSTSSYEAQLKFGDPAFYFKRQLFAILIGMAALVFFTAIGPEFFKKFSYPIYLISVVACIAVIFIGTEGNGASRWIYIGGISVQPSELAKVGVILLVAARLAKDRRKMGDIKSIATTFAYVMPAFIAVAYNNLSTAVIIFGIAYFMLFIAGKRYGFFLILAVVGIAMIIFYISFWGYRSERIAVWQDPGAYDTGYQVMQGLYAIGSGGLFGKGLGESIQKMGFVPEAQNDMIFSIICEELGIVGAICVIVMYILLIWRLMIIATNATDIFDSFVVIGIIIHISIQVILNIAVVTNSMPNTGVSLPFISYGGTSISILIGEIGIALGISRRIYLK